MIIRNKKGTRIKYVHPTAGYPSHQMAAHRHLVIGEVYTIKELHVGGWHTDVYLEEVPDVKFNFVHFEAEDWEE